MKEDWTLVRRIKRGHSYWRHKNGEIGIADNSGTYPENCEPVDKPPLLLDRSRPILLSDSAYCVPVMSNDDCPRHTIAGPFEALWVATTYGMRLRVSETWDADLVEFEVKSVQP